MFNLLVGFPSPPPYTTPQAGSCDTCLSLARKIRQAKGEFWGGRIGGARGLMVVVPSG